jgi:predicted transcriptional regulator
MRRAKVWIDIYNLLDSYEAVRNAVWDFLNIQGEVNALNLANLVGDMIRTEKGEVKRVNQDDLFNEKQNLGDYDDFQKVLDEHPKIKTAREVLHYKQLSTSAYKKTEKLSDFNSKLNTALNYNPKNK